MLLRPALLLSLVLAACSGQPPSAPPAPSGPATPATTNPPTTTPPPAEPERDDGGFADPKVAEEMAEPEVPAAMKEPKLVARVKERFGEGCRPERSCGDMLGVDCNAAADGPYYYVAQSDLKVAATCGGACRRGCTDCPPKGWTCPTY